MSKNTFKKLLFRHYNLLKHKFDRPRSNRALGIIQAGTLPTKRKQYQCTVRNCNCPDSTERGMFCKHRIAESIMQGIYKDVQVLWLEG
jgi:hypothetical protein